MNKYYVYSVKSDQQENGELTHAFVDESYVQEFAVSDYNPLTMKFTGIMVEANNPVEASKLYNNPTSGGEYFMTEEPTATMVKTKSIKDTISDLGEALEDFQEKVSKMVALRLATQLQTQLHDINVVMSKLAKAVRQCSHDDVQVSDEDLYERIKIMHMKQFKDAYRYIK